LTVPAVNSISVVVAGLATLADVVLRIPFFVIDKLFRTVVLWFEFVGPILKTLETEPVLKGGAGFGVIVRLSVENLPRAVIVP